MHAPTMHENSGRGFVHEHLWVECTVRPIVFEPTGPSDLDSGNQAAEGAGSPRTAEFQGFLWAVTRAAAAAAASIEWLNFKWFGLHPD